MKLNYKKTILIGLAFFMIESFWQAYDAVIAKVLTDKFGMSQLSSGLLLSFNNLPALILIPLFGGLSDKCKSKRGRRTPFILAGTLTAALLFIGLSFTDTIQASRISDIEDIAGNEITAERTEAFGTLYDHDPEVLLSGEGISSKKLSELYTREEFVSLSERKMSTEEAELVTKARQSYAWDVTKNDLFPLVVFIAFLFLALMAMASYRSPAMSLMPDVTASPLRSAGNSVVNLMGSVGCVCILGIGILLGTGRPENSLKSTAPLVIATAAVMAAALCIFLVFVKEKKWAEECSSASLRTEIGTEAQKDASGKRKLTKGEFISLVLILGATAFRYMGFNAIFTKYAVYSGEVLSLDYNVTFMIFQIVSASSLIPMGMVSTRIGRKKSILFGTALLGLSMAAASFMRSGVDIWVMNVIFALAALGWSTININALPMTVELAGESDVGRYTGFFYTASMAAQTFTPVLCGVFLTYVSMTTLFPYAVFFLALSFIAMIFVKHGDVRG